MYRIIDELEKQIDRINGLLISVSDDVYSVNNIDNEDIHDLIFTLLRHGKKTLSNAIEHEINEERYSINLTIEEEYYEKKENLESRITEEYDETNAAYLDLKALVNTLETKPNKNFKQICGILDEIMNNLSEIHKSED